MAKWEEYIRKVDGVTVKAVQYLLGDTLPFGVPNCTGQSQFRCEKCGHEPSDHISINGSIVCPTKWIIRGKELDILTDKCFKLEYIKVPLIHWDYIPPSVAAIRPCAPWQEPVLEVVYNPPSNLAYYRAELAEHIFPEYKEHMGTWFHRPSNVDIVNSGGNNGK